MSRSRSGTIKGAAARELLAVPAALLLSFAGISKLLHAISYGQSKTSLPFDSQFLNWAMIVFEITLAAWLLIGIRPNLAVNIATLAFFCFLAYSLYRIANGVEQCGCYGPYELTPLPSLIVNSIVLTFLLAASGFMPNGKQTAIE